MAAAVNNPRGDGGTKTTRGVFEKFGPLLRAFGRMHGRILGYGYLKTHSQEEKH